MTTVTPVAVSPTPTTAAAPTRIAWAAYWQAARPKAYLAIGLPLILGQVFGALSYPGSVGTFVWWQIAIWTHIWGFLYQAFILWINDFADWETDALNTSYFMSGGSRVVAQGKLKPIQLMRGAAVLLGIHVPLAIILSAIYDRTYLWPLMWLALAAGWVYSMPPFRASYHGYGEVTQGVTLGAILPLLSYHMTTGAAYDYPWLTMVPLTMIFFASNINTSLPDVTSDGASRRQTLAVQLGTLEARQLVLVLMLAPAISMFYVTPAPSSVYMRILLLLHAMAGLLLAMRTGAMIPRHINTPAITKRFVFTVATQQVSFLLLYCLSLIMGW